MKKALTLFLNIIILFGLFGLFCLFGLFGCTSKAKEHSVENELYNEQETDYEKEEGYVQEIYFVQKVDKLQRLSREKSKAIKENTSTSSVTPETIITVTTTPESDKTVKTNTDRKTVVIDPGHGAGGNREEERQSPDSEVMKIKDPGGAQGVSSRIPEYVVNMEVALKLKTLLEQNNVNVVMTKIDNNVSPGNIERAETGNINNADLEIRIHCDSAADKSANGASMLVPAPIGYAVDISSISREYGQVILNSLVTEAGMYNRGVIERKDLTGFNWSKVPVVLVEMGFMSSPNEDNLLNDNSYQDKLAVGLCNGIFESLGLN